MNLRRWLAVGIGVKRWLLVAFVGLIVLAVGVAHGLRQVTSNLEPGTPAMENMPSASTTSAGDASRSSAVRSIARCRTT